MSCWTQWLLRIHMCFLLIPLEGKNPDMKKELLINSSWIWKGQIFLVQLSSSLSWVPCWSWWLKSCIGQGDRMTLVAEVCVLCTAQLGSASPNLKLLCWHGAGAHSLLRLVTACSENCYNSQLLLHHSVKRVLLISLLEAEWFAPSPKSGEIFTELFCPIAVSVKCCW